MKLQNYNNNKKKTKSSQNYKTRQYLSISVILYEEDCWLFCMTRLVQYLQISFLLNRAALSTSIG